MTWDFVVVGSGFGGSVSALRLVEKGYRVLLLEKGRRYAAGDFAETNWNLRRWLWAPRAGLRGPFQMTFLRHLTALTGVGVGGGSLVYANTLARPPDDFFRAPSWSGLADWRAELEPFYERARETLGATPCPGGTWPDEIVASVARDLDLEDRHRPVDVGVFYGEPGVPVPDPYFGGKGPDRTGCIGCGGCMLGCRHGAKNTLDLNYLHLAEAGGLEIRPEHEVTWIRPLGRADGSEGYRVEALAGPPRWWRPRRRRTFRARRVVLAGGVLGTVPLLLKLRRDEDGLPRLSERVGHHVRTNSEVLVGVVSGRRERSMSDGVAITSILHTDDRSSLEPVRYPSGSGFFRLLMSPHAPGPTLGARLASAVRRVAADVPGFLRAWTVRDHARHTLILLYMRTLDSHLSLVPGRRGRGFRSRLARGPAPTAAIPEATDLADRVAEKVDGFPASLATEMLSGTPTTAHILGGAIMGEGPADGVVDARHRAFGYEGLFVIDGSAVSANPGVNPSLTIAALAERAMEGIPTKGAEG
ncbi:MAG: GMC family oxidoreductase [Gemmatimonadota bacterium]